MRDIKHLPEAVRSSVRSGIVLFNLTRVVEELIFNSLDARATKVSVAVGVGTHYIKVVDNGCGITWDGLVLLGERYATSKVDQLANTNAISGSFGYRGEALSSISDVSLLEVITKAHGRPNGYRKVMKGCKCLYLGIDDGRQDVGTTVIVRDLFYNQPVRRKHIQSSPKKVLHSVKKCVLRIAIVHPKVFFEVVDIESEDELFCTTPSSSPLSLLTSGFGIEIFSSLHELNVSDGVLKLSGYMSSPRDTSFVKACQFVYINSLYICKGPIHKLLNELVTRFNSSDLQEANMKLQNGKRSRSQTYETYILNLSCPRSWYDITFEPSKTSVEFKIVLSGKVIFVISQNVEILETSVKCDDVDKISKDLKPFLHNCSCRRSLPVDGASPASSEGFDFRINGFGAKRKSLEPNDWVCVGEIDDNNQRFDFLPGTLWDSIESSAIGGECLAGENDLPPDSIARVGEFFSSRQSLKSEWSSVMSDPLVRTKSQNVDNFFDENALERRIKYDNSSRYDYLAERVVKDRGFYFDDSLRKSSSQEDFSTSFANMCSEKAKRSHSTPPFYRVKKKFFTLNTHLAMEAKKLKAQAINNAPTSQETSGLKHPQQSSGECQLYSEPNSVEDPLIYTRPDKKKAHDMKDIKKCDTQKSEDLNIYSKDLVEDCTLKESYDPLDSGLKWQKSCLWTAVEYLSVFSFLFEITFYHDYQFVKNLGLSSYEISGYKVILFSIPRGDKLHNLHNESNILDVSSGILHLAGDSLVPESINKNCLEDAKVLQQVDEKFIPIVGGGVLAIIDQHAADERIHLEELREKVLSGEMKTVTYLDTEQKLVLPEIGYQLLHNYADQIQNWGWLCNIRSLGSRSFKKNLNLLHRQPTVVTLNAVPCIVGVNLTDVDLLEFLQQLADTDGSSTIPPSVHRVLNSKACRGAIMFGDTLLPSECSLIVEELKQTSLCFQCAHGRPTTVPLVNLEALHKQIAKLGLWNGGSNELWHGLHQHVPSLERTAQRLSSARGLS
ncbi:LOW QUALITY PROTEIN: DNA mismatch repair protein MLH3-like [Camellia sinensis]|uniref:LOW QUALITY PROTEIN: DNA mismatch repair protein MLH3-like n=1 Tax=Camellia sinensis TaxID=4442 RepID=UPI001035DD45|nr:LOW QUALITY PROTEIN: DNA mismatch repair protein MLH3-like [Camellia sinensis]